MFKNIMKKIKLIFLFCITTVRLFSMQQYPGSLEDLLKRHNIVLLNQISRGKDKVVYEVVKANERVACSYFLPSKGQPGSDLAKLSEEYSFYNKYRYEGFIKVIDYLCESEHCLLFTELGISDLKKYLKKNEVSFENKIKILINVVETIAYLHSEGVIHGDLKPANIVISFNGAPKVIDPTFSKIIGTEYDYPECTSLFTPPEYLEKVIELETNIVETFKDIASEKFDIFAIGGIIHRLFYGKKIDINLKKSLCLSGFDKNLMKVVPGKDKYKEYTDIYIERLKEGKIFVPGEDIDVRINNLIQACLSSRPDERPSAVEILEELQKIEESFTEKKEFSGNDLCSSIDWDNITDINFY
jgi:serine/threonine protein kinase